MIDIVICVLTKSVRKICAYKIKLIPENVFSVIFFKRYKPNFGDMKKFIITSSVCHIYSTD